MSIRSDEQEIQQLIDDMLVKTEQSVTRAYIEAADAVQAKINALYAKYAKDGVLTYAEMQKAKRFDYLMVGIEKQLIKLNQSPQTLTTCAFKPDFEREGINIPQLFIPIYSG